MQAAIPFLTHFDTDFTLKLLTLHPDPAHLVDLPVVVARVVVKCFGSLQQTILTSTITLNSTVVGIESTSFGNINQSHSLFLMTPSKLNLLGGLPISI